jgi:hypothetical protein
MTINFEEPIWYEPAVLGSNIDLFVTARYQPTGRSPDPCFHLDPKTSSAIGANDSGAMVIDLWGTVSTDDRIASMLFEIDTNLVTLIDGYVNGGYKGIGLPHLLLTMAQELTGWTRGVHGLSDLLLD